MTTTAL